MTETMESRDAASVVMEVIKSRRSSRSFLDKPIAKEDLDDLVEAAIYAPSGSNTQNQRFLVLTDPEKISRLGKLRFVWPWPTNKDPRERVPDGLIGRGKAIILVFADSASRFSRNNGEYYIWQALEVQNCSASIQNILLCATSKGIGSVWVSCTEPMSYSRLTSGQPWRKLLREYEIPATYKIQGCVVLGYARVDSNGYPRGERVHGVDWENTEREDLSYYLIGDRQSPLQEKSVVPGRVRLYRKIIKRLVRLIQSLDRRLGALELE